MVGPHPEPRRELRSLALLAVTCLVAACTTGGKPAAKSGAILDDEDDTDLAHEERLLFDCRPSPGAPREHIQIYEVDPAQKGEPAPKAAVVIELNRVEDGLVGTCGTVGKKYACVSADESLKMEWPSEAPTAGQEAGVAVEESWLFWTKTYRAGCVRKA